MEESTEKVLSELYNENTHLKQLLFSFREACGINPMDSLEEQKRKIRVINYLRLGFIPSHGIDKEWNQRESTSAIPYLVENMRIDELEQLADVGSMAVATVSAFLKGHPTIKIRRAEKAEADRKIAEEQKREAREKTPAMKAEKRAELKGTKAENKAVSALMKTGITEEQARKLLGFK